MARTIKDTSLKDIVGSFRDGVVIANVVATLASTSADSGADTDSRNENIRNINNLNIDVANIYTKLNDALTRLRDKGLLSS